MNFSILNLVFLTSLCVVSLALAMWFFVRMQSRKLWLPTLRVLDLERSQVRKMQRQRPPWIPFFVFLLSSCALLFFTTKPESLILRETTPKSRRVHIFLDFSPSISSFITLPQYIDRVEKIWKDLSSDSKLSVSTSHDGSVFVPTSFQNLQERIYKLGFHRGGIDLASAFKQQREKIGEIDGLILFSDANLLAWKNFNWKFLSEETRVYFEDLRSKRNLPDNLFFREIRLFSAPYDPTLEWDIEIERNGDVLADRRGEVKLVYGGETLSTVVWTLKEGENKTIVRASVNGKKLSKLSLNQNSTLLWLLEPFEADALTLDNSFRTPLKGLRQDALLVGDIFGERQLEDPFYQLNMALQTFGFVPQRMDQWTPALGKTSSPFLILAIDESDNLDETCPLSLVNRRVVGQEQKSQNFPLIWLMPKIANSSMKNLCSCFYKLILPPSENNPCEQAFNLASFSEIMMASGAKAIGGKVSNSRTAIAWFKEDLSIGRKLAAYTVPLKPSRALGIDHASFPLLIQELLQWQGLLDEHAFARKLTEWPRVNDLSQLKEWEDGTIDTRIQESNVPILASYRSQISKEELPPMWTDKQKQSKGDRRFQKEEYDPLFWIRFLFGIILSLMVFESFWNWRKSSKQSHIVLGLFLLCFLAKPFVCFADLSVSVMGANYTPELDNILKEISQRTSIDIQTNAVTYQDAKSNALTEAWYWVRDRQYLLDRKGKFKRDLRYWLKSGGFLVVQNMDLEFLSRMTAEAFASESPDARWQAIPPDHELMRSFYLIDALPSCRGQIWNGFIFDGRLAILSIPFDFLEALADRSDALGSCEQKLSSEYKIRLFINTAMAALATDYKRDQIHMREILKRLH